METIEEKAVSQARSQLYEAETSKSVALFNSSSGGYSRPILVAVFHNTAWSQIHILILV